MKNSCSFAALIIAFFIIMGGCTNKAQGHESSKAPTAVEIMLKSDDMALYSQRRIEIPSNGDRIAFIAKENGVAYFLCSELVQSEESFSSLDSVFSYNVQSGLVEELFEIDQSDGAIQDVAMDSDGNFWVIENSNADYSTNGRYSRVLKYSRLGERLGVWDCDFIDGIYFPAKVYAVGNQLVFRCLSDADSAYDKFMTIQIDEISGMEVLFETEILSSEKTIAVDSENIVTYSQHSGKTVVNEFDAQTGNHLSALQFDVAAIACYRFSDDTVFVDDGRSLYRVDTINRTCGVVLRWGDCGVSAYGDILYLEEGGFLLTGWDESAYLCILSPGQTEGVQTITLGTTSFDYDRAVAEFNSIQNDIRVEIVDYTASEGRGFATDMILDIMSGNTPDILDLSRLPVSQFAENGLFADLNAYVSRSDVTFIDNILKSFEIDGKLYELPVVYSIITLVGNKAEIGESGALSLEEFNNLADDYNGKTPFGMSYSKKDFLDLMLYIYNDVLIDWGGASCSFDGPLFNRILEIASELPDEYTDWNQYEAIRQKKQPFTFAYINSISSIRTTRALYNGIDFSSIGFPEIAYPGSVVVSNYRLGITSSSDSKDGAWAFLEYLSNSYLSAFGLPVTQEGLEAAIGEAIDKESKLREAGESYRTNMGGAEVDVPYMPEADSKMLMDLIYAQTTATRRDTSLNDIVQEEAGAYFAGDKTASETARIIQSRAMIYINERS